MYKPPLYRKLKSGAIPVKAQINKSVNHSKNPTIVKLRIKNKILRSNRDYYKNKMLKRVFNIDSVSDKDLLESCENRFGIVAKRWKEQVKLSKSKHKGHRFSKSYKQFALKQYYQSPTAYKSLASEIILPCKSTLYRMTKDIPSDPGFFQYTFDKMKIIGEKFIEMDKCCIITLDEMCVTQNLKFNQKKDFIVGYHDNGEARNNTIAGQALVFMARGISSSWKQTLGFFFLGSSSSSDELKSMTLLAIRQLKSIGYHPMAIVNDQGLEKLGKALGVTPELPFFEVDGDQIVYLLDTPHLLKSTRNNFVNYNIQFDENEASFRYVVEMFNFFSNQPYSPTPKLTATHLNPTFWQKMSVSLAAQVMSSSVVCGLGIRFKLCSIHQLIYILF